MSSNRVIVDPNGRHFSADSLDRLGDDLMEDILSYLDIKDKSRLQCVSKQFQRLVYNKQTELMVKLLSYRNNTKVDKFLLKCPNITSLSLTVELLNDSLLKTITDCCPRLQSFTFDAYDFSMEAITEFGQQMGDKLKYLCIFNDRYDYKKTKVFLSLCPNLKSLKCEDFLSLDFSGKQFASNLEILCLGLELNLNSSEEMSVFSRFVDKYENTTREIAMNIIEANCFLLAKYLGLISRLTKLESLELKIRGKFHSHVISETSDILAKGLKEMANKVQNMKKINLNVLHYEIDIFYLFARFKHLEVIKFIGHCFHPSVSVAEIEPLMKLKRLEVKCFGNDSYFDHINQFGPNLRALKLFFYGRPNNNLFVSLSQMKQLTRLDVAYIQNIVIDDQIVIALLDNCSLLKKLIFEVQLDITFKTIDRLKKLAKNRPKEVIEFECLVKKGSQVLNPLSDIPHNLIVELKN